MSEEIDAFLKANLVFGATPIGNTADASARLRAALAQADIIAAEDTRRTGELASRLGIKVTGKYLSFHDHNENSRVDQLVQSARNGEKILVVSDAGMPTVSDPGFHLIAAAAAIDLPIDVLPGPSAVLTALALSALPTDRFTFEGFLPRGSGDKRARLEELSTDPRTLILFESPRRLVDTLEQLVQYFGEERPAAVCRELTKTHQEVVRLPLGKLSAEFAHRAEVLGEIVVVVGGANPQEANLAEGVAKVRELTNLGLKTKAAAGIVANWYGFSKNSLYAAYTAGD